MKILYAIAAGLWMQAVSAADVCDGVAAAVAKSADIGAPAVSAACKPWPHDPRLLLSAYAFGNDEDDKTLVVALVDAATRRVVSSYQAVAAEDASVHFGGNSLRIDAAPYQLAPGVRAFGIRFASDARGASCPDGIWTDELTLFVADGQALRPVLRGVPMTRSEARKGMFCSGAGELVFDEARLTVGMAPSTSHGYADLVLSARITRQGGDRQGRVTTERQTLRYDGQAYRTTAQPWWLSFFPLGE